MNSERNRLGRGLAALIGEMGTLEAPRLAESSGVRRLPVEFLVPNRANPRRDFAPEQLTELANSIREKGVMSPLLVRPTRDPNQFEIIAGERRWRASQKAGLNEVPVIIREVDDKEALELAIIENVQRVDLNPLEEALGYQQLIEQFAYTQQDLADVIGKSRSHVANTLRLLNLPDQVRGMVSTGELTAGHARTLITSDDPLALAREIIQRGLSVREAEAMSKTRGSAPTGTRSPVIKDVDTAALEKRLSDVLGLAVSIAHKGESGRVEIRFRSLEQLDDVTRRLTGTY